MRKIEIPVGTKFGHWTTTTEKYLVPGKRHYKINVVCECGTPATVYSAQLSSGRTVRCKFCARGERPVQSGRDYIVSTVLGWYKKSANKRGIEFHLDRDTFAALLFANCYYCGSEPKNSMSDRFGKGDLPRYGGVDRVDNSMGYCYENVVSCCRWCNEAKKAKTTDEFNSWIEGLISHYRGGDRASTRGCGG